MNYQVCTIPVLQSVSTTGQLVVHMCQVAGEDMVEFMVGEQTIVVRREDFSRMTGWIERQFGLLAEHVKLVH